MRDRLIDLCNKKINTMTFNNSDHWFDFHERISDMVDYLIENGVIVTPCAAMVEQFIKDGKFDKRITAHNGKYAVVYIDKTKWSSCPLLDITEQHYNTEKALERIQDLKGGEQ